MCSLSDVLVALAGLVLILDDVLLLELAHALDLVQVHDEALLVAVQWLDTLSTENVEVIAAVEVLDALWVNLAELLRQAILILVLKIEGCAGQDRVFLDHLVEDVDVERQPLSTLQVLDELAADRAPHTVLVVELLDATGAQCVATVDQDAGNALPHVVLHGTELADVQAARLVVQVHQSGTHLSLRLG